MNMLFFPHEKKGWRTRLTCFTLKVKNRLTFCAQRGLSKAKPGELAANHYLLS